MRLTPIPTPTLTGPRNGGGVSMKAALGQGPTGATGPTGPTGAPGPALPEDQMTALTASYAGKGGRTKTDGQNVKNLRRPTLVVDKQWPNARGDHQIVWVDESLKIAYSIGQDHRLRKATWSFAPDEALAWSGPKAESATTERWCDNGVFMRIPTTGELLWESVQKSTGATPGLTTLLRSTDDGATATVVWTASAATKRFLGPQSLVRDANTGYLYMVEYTTDLTQTSVSIWRSTDKGATWTEWKTYPRAETGAGTIRHWHSARYDSVSQRVYFMAGDTNDDAGIYRVNSGGTDIELVVKNSQVAGQFPDTPTCARSVDVMFFPTHLAWACDGGGGQTHLFRMARTQIGQTTPTVERIAAIDSTGWYAQNVSTDGSLWVCSTSTETGISGTTPDPGMVHLYAVSSNGSVLDEVAAVVMDGALLGIASVTGLGGASGAGEAFWLRAQSYQRYPYQSFSAFQMRCRIGYGVMQIAKPPDGPAYDRTYSFNLPTTTIAAGATLTWGGTRAPRRKTSMAVTNYGARTIAGTGGFTSKGKLEVWNATTSTKLFEWTGQSWRYDGKADTDTHTGPFQCASGDQIEFRLTNTDTNPISVFADISIGWMF